MPGREGELNLVVRRTLHLWFRLSRGLTLGVRAAVLDGEGRVALVRHGYAAGWHLPGGGVEAGETASAALIRELAEESALEATAAPILHGIFHSGARTPRDHVLVYVVRGFRDTGVPLRGREIVERGFFPLSLLPDGTTRGTRERLDEIATGRVPAVTW